MALRSYALSRLSGIVLLALIAIPVFKVELMAQDVPSQPESIPSIPCIRGCDGVCNSKKVLDDCKVCGGTGPGECGCDLSITKGCDGVCGSGKEYDECNVCGGTGAGPCGCDGIEQLPGAAGQVLHEALGRAVPYCHYFQPGVSGSGQMGCGFAGGDLFRVGLGNDGQVSNDDERRWVNFDCQWEGWSRYFSRDDHAGTWDEWQYVWNSYYTREYSWNDWLHLQDPQAKLSDVDRYWRDLIATTPTSVEALPNSSMVCGCMRSNLGCFPPGVRVLMEDGAWKLVEEISVGGRIWNPVLEKGFRVKRVIEGPEPLPLVEFGYGETTLRVSQGHAVWAASPETGSFAFIKGGELAVGDLVQGGDGQVHAVEFVRHLAPENGQYVINFILDAPADQPEQHLLLADGIVTGDLVMQQMLAQQ